MLSFLRRKPKSQASISPAMTNAEVELLTKTLRSSDHYLEFGCGGSTVLACQTVGRSVTAVDSSVAWIDQVERACRGLAVVPSLFHIDIGPVAEWGCPADTSRRSCWPNYHSAVWGKIRPEQIDFCLVDGRFRVACFLQALLHLDPKARLAVHDFRSRPEYHTVLEFAREEEVAEDLSVFRRIPEFDKQACLSALERYRFVSD